MRDSISLGRVCGFPLEMHFSTIALLGLLAFLIGFGRGDIMGLPVGFESLAIPWYLKAVFGIICGVLLYYAIVLHEVAHGIVARGNGQEVKGITLLFYGGMVDIGEESPYVDKKGDEMMAFAGPATNLALGAALLLSSQLLNGLFPDLAFQIVVTMLGVLGFYNMLLGVFNLLPGYPMDGGLILRSYLRKRMDQERVTHISVRVCRVIAYVLGFVGIWEKSLPLFLIALLLYLSTHMEDPDFNYKPQVS